MKAGKIMFFREDGDWTVQRVLSSFGDLPSVYLKSGYGKYSARLGLSFSSTVESLDVSSSIHSVAAMYSQDSFRSLTSSRSRFPISSQQTALSTAMGVA